MDFAELNINLALYINVPFLLLSIFHLLLLSSSVFLSSKIGVFFQDFKIQASYE